MNHAWRAALVTPPGMSAIAVVAIRGEQAFYALVECLQLRSRRKLADMPVGAIHVAGFFHSLAGDSEEVVIARLEPDLIEIQCHGGRGAAQSILNRLAERGAIVVDSGQWADLEDACPLRAAARRALSQAATWQATRILLDQFRGALREEIDAIGEILRQQKCALAMDRLGALIERSRIGLRLIEGFRVVLLGRPNVGKSSLFNTFLGYGRAIVLDQPGTTRDVLTAQAAVGGWPLTLLDLAGVREPTDLIEAEGVRRAREMATQADLVLIVSDGSQAWSAEEERLLENATSAVVVHNKCDLSRSHARRPDGVWISAATGEGLADLERAMLEKLIVPRFGPGDAVAFELSQFNRIANAMDLLGSGDLESAKGKLLQLRDAAAYAR